MKFGRPLSNCYHIPTDSRSSSKIAKRDIETMTSKTIINYKGRGLRRWYLAYSLVGSQLEKIQDGRNIWAGIVVPSLSCQRQFRAAAILPPLISGSNQNDSRDFVRRFGPLGVHQLRVMQLRLNANELTLDRKWLYAPLAANSKAITIPFFPPPLINLSSSSFRKSISTRHPNISLIVLRLSSLL